MVEGVEFLSKFNNWGWVINKREKNLENCEILLWNEHLSTKGTKAVKSMFDCNEFNLVEVNGTVCQLQDNVKSSTWCRMNYKFVVV